MGALGFVTYSCFMAERLDSAQRAVHLLQGIIQMSYLLYPIFQTSTYHTDEIYPMEYPTRLVL
jgi:hypothetical protein